MMRLQWIALGLLAFVVIIQAKVSVEYTDCPNDCKCVKTLKASVMTCKTLFTENLVSNIPISHFVLSESEAPITLTENIFFNMGLQHVNVISIIDSNIESIDKNAFKNLTELTHIQMVNSRITKLHPETFSGLPKLKTLKLAGNPLNKDVVIMSENLEQLVIPNCELSEISSSLFENLPSITFIDLSNNNIETLSNGVFDTLEDLEEINLSHNKLKEIPKDLFTKNLHNLNLSYNPLVTFSGAELEDLETLDLKSCSIEKIDSSMFKNMHKLSNLDLSYNKIASIEPNSFNNMTDLSAIDLSGNEIPILDDNIFEKNNNLQKIRLDDSKLLKLPNFNVIGYFSVHYFSCNNCNLRVLSKETFKNMPAIVTLLLAHNNINDISTNIFHNLTSLIELDLSYNEIQTIEDHTFEHNTNLQTLTLSFNPLKSFHAQIFKNNINLKYLSVSSCGLYELWSESPGDIKLSAIASLNISNNNINILTQEDIQVTNNLKSLDISQNPLECNTYLRDLVQYLYQQNIKNTQYITHEKQSYDFEDRDKDILSWREIVQEKCPKLLDDEDMIEDEQDDFEDDFEEATEMDLSLMLTYSNDIKIEDIKNVEANLLPLKHSKYNYSYMWPILIFIGTALAVLGLVVNIVLFILRRKQNIVPSIIHVPKMSSRLKTNSGLVYQQLSEEHGTKTPILGRFTPVTGVQNYPNETEHV